MAETVPGNTFNIHMLSKVKLVENSSDLDGEPLSASLPNSGAISAPAAASKPNIPMPEAG